MNQPLPKHPNQPSDFNNQLAHVSRHARAVLDLRDVGDAVLRFRGGHWRHDAAHQTTIEICHDRHGTKFLLCGRPGGPVVVMLPFESRHRGALANFEEAQQRRLRGPAWVRLARRCIAR